MNHNKQIMFDQHTKQGLISQVLSTILCILIEISVKIRMAKKNGGSYLSCVMNSECYFSYLNLEFWINAHS